MSLTRRALMCMAMLSLTVALPHVDAVVPREETLPYTAGAFSGAACNNGSVVGATFGQPCFRLDGSEARVRVLVRDNLLAHVGGNFIVRAADGGFRAYGEFCDAVSIPLPADGAQLFVGLGREWSLQCPLGSVAIPTTGTVTASFV